MFKLTYKTTFLLYCNHSARQ